MAVCGVTVPSGTSTEPISSTDLQTHKVFSCVLCAQRKVKCDKRLSGCNNCSKGRVPCLYKAPPPPRRRKKGVRDVDTATKLRVYEAALRKAGLDPESLLKDATLYNNNQSSDGSIANDQLSSQQSGFSHQTPDSNEIGVLVTEHGKSRYLENGVWTSLRSEFRDLKDILDESSDEELSSGNIANAPESFHPDGSRLLFGSPMSSIGLRPLHPQPIQAFKLWQTYLDNVNPLIKLFHAPTVQQLMSEANGNLDGIPRNVEALLFAIYCIAVESLSDGECITMMGEPKDVVRQRFRSGAQHALINASFLKTSDVMVLQALTLFIVSHPLSLLDLVVQLTRIGVTPKHRCSHNLDVIWCCSASRSAHRPTP